MVGHHPAMHLDRCDYCNAGPVDCHWVDDNTAPDPKVACASCLSDLPFLLTRSRPERVSLYPDD